MILNRVHLVVLILISFSVSLSGQRDLPSLFSKDSSLIASGRHFGMKEGLPERIIFNCHQDQSGYFWLTTNQGLIRWDGHQFKIVDALKEYLPFRSANNIQEDLEGNLWISPTLEGALGNYEKWIVYDPILDQATPVSTLFPVMDSLFLQQTPSFYGHRQLSEDLYMFRDLNQAWLWNESTQEASQLFKVSRPGIAIRDVFLSNNLIALVTTDSLDEYDQFYYLKKDGTIVRQFDMPPGVSFLSSKKTVRYQGFKPDDKGCIWMYQHWNGQESIGCIIPNPNKSNLNFHPKVVLDSISPIHYYRYNQHQQSIWMLFGDRLLVHFLNTGQQFELSGEQYTNRISKHTDILFSQTQPETGWFFGGEGLTLLKIKNNYFHTYLPGQSIRGVVKDKQGNLFVNTVIDSKKIDRRSETVSSIKAIPANVYPQPVLFTDRSGTVWGFPESRLSPFNKDSDEKYTLKGSSVAQAVYEHSSENSYHFWIAGDKRLLRFYPEEKRIESVSPVPFHKEFSSAIKYGMYPEDKDHFWICSSKGIFLCHETKGIIEHYHTNGSEKFYLPSDFISYMHKDQEGIYWLSTKGDGLIRWDKEKGEFNIFTMEDGLSNNVLYAVYEDNNNRLWLPSNYGLMSFSKETDHVNTYLEEDGIAHNEFNTWSHYRDEQGWLYFGGLNGVTIFHPDQIELISEKKDPPLRVTELEIENSRDGRYVSHFGEFQSDRQIVVHPSQRSVILTVSLLDYDKTEEHIYGFRIKGFDKEWSYQKHPNYRIPKLPYGQYTLRVKARGAEGRWIDQDLEIPIRYIAPFYRTILFVALVILALGGLVFSGFVLRIKQLRKNQLLLEREVAIRTQTIQQQAEKLKELDEAKSRFFADVSHELRTPLTLILGPADTLLKRQEEKSEEWGLLNIIQENGQKLLKLINEILNLTKLDSGQLEVQETSITFYPQIKKVVDSFLWLAGMRNIQIQFDYQGNQDLQLVVDKNKLEIILNNLLSNAIKFTDSLEGKISVVAKEVEDTIQITVEDNGPGISKEDLPRIFDRYFQADTRNPNLKEEGTGIGLALCKEYAELLGGRLYVHSTLGKGSCFGFEFPKKASSIFEPTVFIDTTPPLSIESAEHTSDNGASIPVPNKHTNLLIVEDNPNLQDFLKIMLQDQYQITIVSNGQLALDYLKKESDQVDLILSDIMMPVMDGVELLKQLKSDKHLRRLPIIMLTARAGSEDRLEALRIGVDDYLTKPFNEEELKLRINNLLENARNRQAFAESAEEPVGEGPSGKIENVSEVDHDWLQELEENVISHLHHFNFNTDFLAEKLGTSRRQLQRRIKKLTGLTTNQYIQEARFQRARHLLEQRKYDRIKNVAFAVGFKDVAYFSKKFKDRYGRNPSEYM
jgi:signal transduction histidine kinase/DNA-binding response OmpR family regulator